MRLIIVITLTLSTQSLIASGQPSCAQLNKAWNAQYHYDFGVQWPKRSFSCPSATATLARAFFDIENSETSFDFYQWIQKKIATTIYQSDCESRVVATMNQDGRLKICPAFFQDTASSQTGTMVHEAAHTVLHEPRHIVCRSGAYRGKRACDARLEEKFEGGAYNREFFFLKKLYDQNYQGIQKSVLRMTLKQMAINRFNVVSNSQMNHWSSL